MTRALANALTPIFAGLFLGYWAGRRGWMDSVNVRNLIVLVMDFTVPCAMFSLILQSSRAVLQRQAITALAIALIFVLVYVGCYVWARRYWRMSISDAAVLALTIGFPNCAAVALSLLSDVFGAEAAISAALSLAVGSITVSPVTLAILEAAGDKGTGTLTSAALVRGVRDSFLKPVVWAPLLALLFVLLGLHLPTYGMAAVDALGTAANGSALVLTGLVVSAQRFQINGPVIWTTLVKLVGQPLLALALWFLLPLSASDIRNVALIGAIPGGFFGLVFGKSYNATPEAASSGLVASYVLSVITLPLWIVILTKFV